MNFVQTVYISEEIGKTCSILAATKICSFLERCRYLSLQKWDAMLSKLQS